VSAREVALQVVRDVFPTPPQTSERGAQEAFDYRASKSGIDARDRAFATELAYGSIKMRRTLDWYLQSFVGQRSQPLPEVISEILRLAIYEIVFTRADEHATVFEFVNLAKKYGHRGVVGLTNAVLRSFLRDRPLAPTRDLFEDDDDYLGVAYSLPTWIVRQWRAVFPQDLEAICAAVNLPPATAITVNAARSNVADVLESLQAAGVQARRSVFVEESVVVGDAAYVRAHERDAAGGWWVQSESSAMPVPILNPQPGEASLDVASGRGSKALQIAARANGAGTLLCIERDERKAKVLENRVSSAGLAAGVVIGDATTDLLAPEQRFDRVLVDAPCSGVGVLGRHPEARWRKRVDDGARLSATQTAMLAAVAGHVHEGGVLVYAVCSTDPRETTEVVASFLRAYDFSRGLTPGVFEPFLTQEGDVLVPPGVDGRDGFYIARLERRL
jgi:16S rRNA (cytosine967-C5)-methyltransferase